MKRKKVRIVVASTLGALVLVALAFGAAWAKGEYPSKPIRWVVPYSPGGGFDVYSRAVARYLPKYLPGEKKVDVIIQNVTGAGGNVGVTKVYNSKPDGYTVGIMNTIGVCAATVLAEVGLKGAALRFDVRELTYIGVISENIYCLCVGKNSPYQSLKALQNAKVVKFASVGVGGSEWGHTVLVTKAMGIKVRHVTGYAGSTPSRLSVVAGDTHALMATVGSAWAQIQAGDLMPLFYIKKVKQYFPEAPDRPTATELGYPELVKFCGFWRHVIAPPGLPQKRAKILENALWKVVQDPKFRAWSKKARRPIILPAKAKGAKETVIQLIDTLRERADVFKAALEQ